MAFEDFPKGEKVPSSLKGLVTVIEGANEETTMIPTVEVNDGVLEVTVFLNEGGKNAHADLLSRLEEDNRLKIEDSDPNEGLINATFKEPVDGVERLRVIFTNSR